MVGRRRTSAGIRTAGGIHAEVANARVRCAQCAARSCQCFDMER
jgi:hypothetical protein